MNLLRCFKNCRLNFGMPTQNRTFKIFSQASQNRDHFHNPRKQDKQDFRESRNDVRQKVKVDRKRQTSKIQFRMCVILICLFIWKFLPQKQAVWHRFRSFWKGLLSWFDRTIPTKTRTSICLLFIDKQNVPIGMNTANICCCFKNMRSNRNNILFHWVRIDDWTDTLINCFALKETQFPFFSIQFSIAIERLSVHAGQLVQYGSRLYSCHSNLDCKQ